MMPLVLLLSTTATTPAPEADVTRRLQLTPVVTSAFGTKRAKFFNQLIGARLEYRFGPRFTFGGILSYANLRGKDERVHNVLPEATLGYRLPLKPSSVSFPLRLSLGFMRKNGPTFRVSAGFEFAFSERVALEVTPFEPMLWVTDERAELSLDGTAGLRLSF